MSAIAFLCAILTTIPHFRKPKFRVHRTALYASIGLTWIVFVANGVIRYGWQTQDARMSLRWIAAVALADLVGAVAFATRVRSLSARSSEHTSSLD